MTDTDKIPPEWKEMVEKAELVASEIHECVNNGGDWRYVITALMGFALAIKDMER